MPFISSCGFKLVSSALSFLAWRTPYIVKQVCWQLILSVFVYLGMSWFFLHFWRMVSVFLANFFFPVVEICHPTAFWHLQFLVRNHLLILLQNICMWWVTSPLLLSRFSLSLGVDSLIMMCQLWTSVFSILEVCWCVDSYFSSCFGSFGLLFLQIFLLLRYLPSLFYEIPILSMLILSMASHRFMRLCLFYFIHFSFCFSDLIISVNLF